MWWKKGIVLPLILVLLLVLCMLGLFMNKSAQYEYGFTFRSTDHLRALYLADAAIQATLAQIKEDMNKAGTVRDAMVGIGSGPVIKDTDLRPPYSIALSALEGTMNDNDGTNMIDTCRIVKIETDAKVSDSLLLHQNLFTDPKKFFGDRTRRLIITAQITFSGAGNQKQEKRSFKKIVHQSFDVKVADVRPVGNRYVLMVAKIDDSKKDFNTGNHFWVKNKSDTGAESVGISIADKEAVVDLFPLYSGHEDWEKYKSDVKYDIFNNANDANSPKSLIPGWDDPMDDAFKPEDKDAFVADNEPWEVNNKLSMAKKSNILKELSGAAESKGKPADHSAVANPVHLKSKEGVLLNASETGGAPIIPIPFPVPFPVPLISDKGGHLLEEESDPTGISYLLGGNCGFQIEFAALVHPLKKVNDGPFFNSGLDTGRTHLFYENCSVPCPIFGDVKKNWKVYLYKSIAAGETGKDKVEEGPVCRKIFTGGDWTIRCYHHNSFQHKNNTAWDTNDEAQIEVVKIGQTQPQATELKGQYQIKDNNAWSAWNKDPIEINLNLNLKSDKNLTGITAATLIKKQFLIGATRRVLKLGDDATLLAASNKLYPEGVVDVTDCGDMKLIVNSPGALITDKAFTLSSSSYNDQNGFFKAKTALSLVTQDIATIGTSPTRAGICCKSADTSGGGIKLQGNLVVEKIVINGKKEIQGRLFYDGVLKDDAFIVDNVGDNDEKASLVVSISPIPQEYFDEFNLK
ncbi:MAG: hypothetical protein PHW04_11335 [Candidatus Wallbacteria bacterium]|nr:hypothetical protein [Candidatus Wallbacteria bacterium]